MAWPLWKEWSLKAFIPDNATRKYKYVSQVQTYREKTKKELCKLCLLPKLNVFVWRGQMYFFTHWSFQSRFEQNQAVISGAKRWITTSLLQNSDRVGAKCSLWQCAVKESSRLCLWTHNFESSLLKQKDCVLSLKFHNRKLSFVDDFMVVAMPTAHARISPYASLMIK